MKSLGAHKSTRRAFVGLTFAIAAFVSLAWVAMAPAKEFMPKLSPLLSLTADCSTSSLDPIEDPGCPYSAAPDGPSGRFARPTAVTIDSFGNEFVVSEERPDVYVDDRIDIFDDEGIFLTELSLSSPAKSIGVDSDGVLYAFGALFGEVFRYVPSKYEPDIGVIEYANAPTTILGPGSFVGSLAVDGSNDHLFVVKGTVITEYGSAKTGNEPLDAVDPEALKLWNESMVVDGQRRRLFVAHCKSATEDCAVLVLDADSPHAVLGEIDGSSTPTGTFVTSQGRLALGVDEQEGNVFVGDFAVDKLYRFDEDFEYQAQVSQTVFTASGGIAVSNGETSVGDAFNRHYVFATTYDTNRALAFEPPGVVVPKVLGMSVESIGETDAILHAEIDPGGSNTTYRFEYTSQASFEASGFTEALIAGEGSIPGSSVQIPLSVPIAGLAPGTAYRFRVLAENEAGKAAPIAEGTFVTHEDPPATDECPNQALRVGAAAALPDCRAYELVTPGETNGRPPLGVSAIELAVIHASPLGDAVSFRFEGGSLPGSTGTGSFLGDRYVATRGPGGWTTALDWPSGDEATIAYPEGSSPDQAFSFFTVSSASEGPLAEGGTDYVRYPDGHSELISKGSLGGDPHGHALLVTEDATHLIFTTVPLGLTHVPPIQLEPDAAPSPDTSIYDRTIDPQSGAEQTHVVSLRPNETPAPNPEYVGGSADGIGIAFESLGTLYLRKDNAVTYEIGDGVEFAGVAESGRRIFYVEDGDLLAFDTASEAVVPFSESGDVTPVNVAADGARAYFISPSLLAGEANPHGDLPQSGEQNLYLSTEGQVSFVATVTDDDAVALGQWTRVLTAQPGTDPSRLNPDGTVALFEARGDVTGYDSGEVPQVYRYDSAGNRLQCLSCNPTGAPSGGGANLQSYAQNEFSKAPLSPNGVIANLTPDGKRAFFESTEALVSADTDGLKDVYEWEEEGTGSCVRSGGCVYLISSGNSATDNYLYAQSSDGEDVFFTSSDRLTGDDPSGTVSIYDARVNGGFAPSSGAAGECLGEACQPAATAPQDPALASSTFHGKGNLSEEGKVKSRCPKGKRRVRRAGKARCVKAKRLTQRQRKAANRMEVSR